MSRASYPTMLLRRSLCRQPLASSSSAIPSSRAFSSAPACHRNLPSRRPRDPLASDPSAIRHHLPTGETLIIRPPPSVQSPYNLEQPNKPSIGDMNAESLPDTSILPPPLRPSFRHVSPATTILSVKQIQNLQSLRRQDPTKNTASSLAKQFNVSPLFVSIVAPLPSDYRKLMDHQLETKKANWGANKSLQRILRKERKALW